MRMMIVIGFGLLVGLAGCSKESGGPAPAGSGPTASGGGGGGAGGSKTSLTQAQLDEGYKLADPDKIDDSIKKVTAKLGPPTKSEGDASIWYGAGKDNCYQLRISKTKGIDSGTTDKANCGMK